MFFLRKRRFPGRGEGWLFSFKPKTWRNFSDFYFAVSDGSSARASCADGDVNVEDICVNECLAASSLNVGEGFLTSDLKVSKLAKDAGNYATWISHYTIPS
jgi:hypothetical protein